MRVFEQSTRWGLLWFLLCKALRQTLLPHIILRFKDLLYDMEAYAIILFFLSHVIYVLRLILMTYA